MRLTELFQKKQAVKSTRSNRIIPLWVLESDRATYDRWIAHDMFDRVTLTEALIDKYRQSLSVVGRLEEQVRQQLGRDYPGNVTADAEADLLWAVQVLKKQDRIVWYLRFVKAGALDALYFNSNQSVSITYKNNHPDADLNVLTPLFDAISKEIKKAKANLAKMGFTEDDLLKVTADRAFKRTIHHFLNTPARKIQELVWDRQKPQELLKTFHAYETEWQSTQGTMIPVDAYGEDEIEKIIEFPDGSAWFDLKRSGCSTEAAAMGHCGNGSGYNGQTVLSYRTPRNNDGEQVHPEKATHWRPSLTFILEPDGRLGEMKGRANQKPSKKYHPQIVALLRHPRVTGIQGGGFEPQRNFSLGDLDDDVRHALVSEKPELGGPLDIWRIDQAVSERFLKSVKTFLDQYELEIEEINEQGDWVLESFRDINAFVDEASNALGKGSWGRHTDTVGWVQKVLTGDTDIDHYYEDIDNDTLARFVNDVCATYPSIRIKLRAYMEKAYPDEFGSRGSDEYDDDDHDDDYSEYDLASFDDLIAVAKDGGEEWIDQFKTAYNDGNRLGAEKMIYEAMKGWLAGGCFGRDAALDVELVGQDGKSPPSVWDQAVAVVTTTKSMLQFIEDCEKNLVTDMEDWGGRWLKALDIEDIDEPYSGWSDYDEDGAIESAFEQFYVDVDDAVLNPDGGDADILDAKRFREAILTELGDGIGRADDFHIHVHGPFSGTMSAPKAINGVVAVSVWLQADNRADRARDLGAAMTVLRDVAVQTGQPVLIAGFKDEGFTDRVMMENQFEANSVGLFRYDPRQARTMATESTRIKLGGKRPYGPQAFMNELRRSGQAHPFSSTTILFGPVGVQASEWEGNIHIEDIRTFQDRGQGHASEVLKMLTHMADRYDVSLTGTAKVYDSQIEDRVPTSKRLAQWYRKHGFKILRGNEDDGYEIVYTPREEE